ncbi:MAG: MFS transporter [Burkholderiales bacterium]|nr:MFS transporter [Burkholderiales bacterium]
MQMIHSSAPKNGEDDYLYSPRTAWFTFAMTVGLMLFDYIDRQVIVSLFPHIKAEWQLSDKQLGALVSIVSITVALGSVPVALFADRVSRVKSIFFMAFTWSIACISCMFTRNYAQLLTARAVVGVGEAGYGAVGAALIASHFPSRMRGTLLAGFFAAASVGSVLGVVLGGVISAHWGWKTAFGVVGLPGLVLAVLYLKVKDYHTVELTAGHSAATQSVGGVVRFIAGALGRSRTVLWTCVGAAFQLIVVSAIWSWLPSYLNRFHGLPTDQASIKAALVVLCGALGSVVWGWVVDRVGLRSPRNKLFAMALLCLLAMVLLGIAFGIGVWFGTPSDLAGQFGLVALGGFVVTCTVGPVSAIVIDVVHPGVRSTGSSVLSLFQNLFGLAAGPFIAGILSDELGLQVALAIMPVFGVFAALSFIKASGHYESDRQQLIQAVAA